MDFERDVREKIARNFGGILSVYRSNCTLVVALAAVICAAGLMGGWTWPKIPKLQANYDNTQRTEQYRPGGRECALEALASIKDGARRARQASACSDKAEQYRLDTNDLIQQTRAADAANAQAQIASQG